MPFTPFHMGPALLLKGAARQRFSLLVFGGSQVLIDLDPLVRILRGDAILHGFTHTLTGAFLVGLVAAAIGRPLSNWFLGLLRRESRERWAAPLLRGDVTWGVALASAWIGTGSHLVLDGIMHADIRPLAPVTDANPLHGLLGLGTLHLFCLAAGAIGAIGVIVGSVADASGG